MPLKISCHELASPLGALLLAGGDNGLAAIEFGLDDTAGARRRLETRLRKRFREEVELTPASASSACLRPVIDWLERYFMNPAGSRTYPESLDLGGTRFQRLVWMRMLQIPAGATMSYKEMAAVIGHPRAARAVGGACGANPVPVIIPCHRVTASGGLGGFGPGVALKVRMLASEGVKPN